MVRKSSIKIYLTHTLLYYILDDNFPFDGRNENRAPTYEHSVFISAAARIPVP